MRLSLVALLGLIPAQLHRFQSSVAPLPSIAAWYSTGLRGDVHTSDSDSLHSNDDEKISESQQLQIFSMLRTIEPSLVQINKRI